MHFVGLCFNSKQKAQEQVKKGANLSPVQVKSCPSAEHCCMQWRHVCLSDNSSLPPKRLLASNQLLIHPIASHQFRNVNAAPANSVPTDWQPQWRNSRLQRSPAIQLLFLHADSCFTAQGAHTLLAAIHSVLRDTLVNMSLQGIYFHFTRPFFYKT